MFKLIPILILISCAHNSPFKMVDDVPLRLCNFPQRVVADSSVAFSSRKNIGLSVEYWQDATDRWLFSFVQGPSSINSVVIQKVEDDGKLSSRDLIVSTTRKCIVGARIYLRNKAFEDENVLQTIIRKELGYVLGLNSSSDFTDLMYHDIEMTLQHPVDANKEQTDAVNSVYSDGACY